MLTRAPGTAPPEGSVTWPVMLPVSCCARSGTTGNSRTEAKYAARLRHICDFPPARWICGHSISTLQKSQIGRQSGDNRASEIGRVKSQRPALEAEAVFFARPAGRGDLSQSS